MKAALSLIEMYGLHLLRIKLHKAFIVRESARLIELHALFRLPAEEVTCFPHHALVSRVGA